LVLIWFGSQKYFVKWKFHCIFIRMATCASLLYIGTAASGHIMNTRTVAHVPPIFYRWTKMIMIIIYDMFCVTRLPISYKYNRRIDGRLLQHWSAHCQYFTYELPTYFNYMCMPTIYISRICETIGHITTNHLE